MSTFFFDRKREQFIDNMKITKNLSKALQKAPPLVNEAGNVVITKKGDNLHQEIARTI